MTERFLHGSEFLVFPHWVSEITTLWSLETTIFHQIILFHGIFVKKGAKVNVQYSCFFLKSLYLSMFSLLIVQIHEICSQFISWEQFQLHKQNFPMWFISICFTKIFSYKFQNYAQNIREYFSWTAICSKIKVRKSHYYVICQLNLMKVGSVPLWLVHSVSLRRPQCENSRNFLSTRFYVKSLFGIFKNANWQNWRFWWFHVKSEL